MRDQCCIPHHLHDGLLNQTSRYQSEGSMALSLPCGGSAKSDGRPTYTIDTFSLSIVLSLSDHPLYVSGRKNAAYRWRKPAPDQDASNPVQPKVTRYEKEETARSVDSAHRIGLSARSRRAGRKRLRMAI